MSLVGKQLEVNFFEAGDDASSSKGQDDVHVSLSPANGAEALFMSGLKTSTISANALASELRKNQPRSLRSSFRSSSASTTATDDFHSTFDNVDDLEQFYTYNPDQQPIYELDEDSKMSTAASKINVDEVNVDAAAHVYETAKNVWGWGKEQMIISNFLGIAEGIAGKIVSVAGTDLEEIDGKLKPELSKFDSGILNPAIKAVLGIILNAAGKGEEVFKPIVVSILKPLGLLESKKNETPELTNPRATGRVS